MTIRQQLIHDRVLQVSAQQALPDDEAFERFAHSTYTGQSIYSFDVIDLVDGSSDKQIDLISIFEDDGEAEIFILSTKFTRSFSSNAIILFRNGLNWIFNKPRCDVQKIQNIPFRDKIFEIRSILNGIGPSNISLRCAFITNGLLSEVSSEYQQERDTILQEFDNSTFKSFTFDTIGADELVDLLNASEKKDRRIDADIPIKYDANNPSLIKYHSEGLKGLVCTASARDIAKIVNEDSSGAVFDSNIRRFLGTRGSVNSDIIKTCSTASLSYQFWFLNNGITIICDRFDPTTDPDDPKVKIKNLQIVNGCQTATALSVAARNGDLKPDARVLLRIYESADPELVDRIVLTTNNQNKISNRDLRANDSIQIDMEQAFFTYGYLYERKVNQYKGQVINQDQRIVSNDIVGQCYLGVVMKRPADARRRKYKIWSDAYDEIFTGSHIEPHVLSVMIVEQAERWILDNNKRYEADDLIRKIVKNGVYHIARISAAKWRKTDSWTRGMTEQIRDLKSNPSLLNDYLEISLQFLERLIRKNPAFENDIDAALKSNFLEREISRNLRDAP
jgi:hypothetical protein